jgi:hypothetical protein
MPCAGLTLVVGPNSSDKTQFLNDLYLRLCGEPRKLVVAAEIEINKPECEALMQSLEREGYINAYTADCTKRLDKRNLSRNIAEIARHLPLRKGTVHRVPEQEHDQRIWARL